MGDGRAWVRTAGDGGGRPGTTRVTSHDINLAGTEGPSARTIVPIVRPVLTLPGVVRPSTPKKTDYEP